MNSKIFKKLLKYDFLVFFREPFFALPILVLPGILFYIFMTIFGVDENIAEFIPAYSLLISVLVLFFNIGLQFVNEKERGVHKRLLLSPITKVHLIAAYLVRGVAVSLLGLIEIFLIANLAFGMSLTNSLPLFLVVYLLIIGILLLISLSLHDFFNNTKQTVLFTVIIFQYALFSLGFMIPIDQAPTVVRWLIHANPIYHMNHILTNIWLSSLENVTAINVVYLIGVIVVCSAIVKFHSSRREL